MHRRISAVQHNLMCAIESQMNNLHSVDTEELGEAIDMLKDLEKARYYCMLSDQMEEEKEKSGHHYEGDSHKMYYEKKWIPYEGHPPLYLDDIPHWTPYYEEGEYHEEWDDKKGKSPHSRKMYMEAKSFKDKATQLRELEKYMQELSGDIVEMIQDASPEEKQYLEKKISALATKVGQMK